MRKVVPVWLLLLVLLLGGIFVIIFGWSIKDALAPDGSRSGSFGRTAVTVASFPDLVEETFMSIPEDRDVDLRVPRAAQDLKEFQPVRMKPSFDLQGLLVRADMPALARTPAWRVLVGTFVVDSEPKEAVLAFSPELELVKIWFLGEEQIPGGLPPHPVGRRFVHGFVMLSDGSMIFAFDGGVSLQRMDVCGKHLWGIAGEFNHSVSVEENEKYVWTLKGWDMQVELVRVATETGEIVSRIRPSEIVAANPMIDILEIGKDADWPFRRRSPGGEHWWMHNPYHFNDIEPLPSTLADRFPMFHSGDLLLSARNLNLVFVMDPRSLEVKWWRSGAWLRQHDPDWQPNGEITLLDNRTGRGYSRIVGVNPNTNRLQVLFDGRDNHFYTWRRGKHQITQADSLLVTSPEQGHVFEVDANGDTVFEMINTKPGSKEFSYLISEAISFPIDSFPANNTSCSE